MPVIDHTVLDVIETVRSQFPNVPFLALGQTVFWDEPTKAIWRRLLDLHLPDATMVAGVHDTDYFAKTTAHVHTTQRYAILPHDDGLTHDLWSAAGELSALFGSESVPTRQMFLNHGVPFEWLARTETGGRFALTAALTTAWGWRAIVRTDALNVVARDIPAAEFGDVLLAQLDWGFETSIACLDDEESRTSAIAVAKSIRSWVEDFLAACDQNCRLGHLYQTLLPRFYELLLGDTPRNLITTTSSELFRFNRETCMRDRFQILDAFLNPETRAAAQEAYDSAVSGSGIYTLAKGFGQGAIPFEIVVPNMGRGTIRITRPAVLAEIGGRLWRGKTPTPLTNREQLAAIIEDSLGPDAIIVGKAVVLADMISAEHIVLFNESGSGYTPLTRRMNDSLASAGFNVKAHPIVRLTYNTWDAVGAGNVATQFRLPEYLASTFGAETVSAREFSSRWREVVDRQRQFLTRSKQFNSLRELLRFLQERQPNRWEGKLSDYENALATLKLTGDHSAILGDRIDEHRREMAIWVREGLDLERRKGEDWRANSLPLVRQLQCEEPGSAAAKALEDKLGREEAIRANAFDERIAEAHDRIIATRTLIAHFRYERRKMERSPENLAARAFIAQITREAQLARAELVRNAFQTIEGLEHTQVRPTAWWLPLADRSGSWFDAMVAGTKARFEWITEPPKV